MIIINCFQSALIVVFYIDLYGINCKIHFPILFISPTQSFYILKFTILVHIVNFNCWLIVDG